MTNVNRHSIFAKITPKREYLNEARQALQELILPTLDEDGCYVFRLQEDGDGHLYLYEEFENEAALHVHMEKDYTKSVFALYDTWLATPLEITKMTRIA